MIRRPWTPRLRKIAAAGIACFVLAHGAGKAIAQQPISASLVAGTTNGLSQPLFVTAPVGDSRLFIVEKGGAIKVQTAPNTTPSTFIHFGSGTGNLDLIDTVGERGLLGMAFDPNYATNGRFYVNYIDKTSLHTKIVRYTVPNPASNSAAGATAELIITVDQPAGRSNHKAGWLGFRPNEPNNLYIATGDGGSGNDPDQFAQNTSSNLGKMLRLNVSGSGAGYTIPAGNPFVGVAGNDEIWAYGLRNPFRNSFDRVTGHFYIADVGQDTREEMNIEEAPGIAGRNYGWRALEGNGDNPGVGDAAPPGAVPPLLSYSHSDATSFASGSAGSITGGYVYRGSLMPALQGTYFFADYVSGKIGSLVYDDQANAISTPIHRTTELGGSTNFGPFTIASFGEDGFGELYIVDISGEVYKIVPEPGAVMSLCLAGLSLLRRRRS